VCNCDRPLYLASNMFDKRDTKFSRFFQRGQDMLFSHSLGLETPIFALRVEQVKRLV
jgi:hypothetical protein